MTCPSLGSSSDLSLWYAADPDPAAALPGTFTWHEVPMTGESVAANLSSTVSEQINSRRAYVGSRLTGGELGGSINFESQANQFIFNMLISVLQADKALTFGTGTENWAANTAIQNGSVKKCFAFMKRIQKSATTFDFYVFRGIQIGSMTLEVGTDGLITGAIGLMGTKPETPLENVVKPAGWTLTAIANAPLMSGVDGLRDFDIQTSAGVTTALTMENLTLSIENGLRAQRAVGKNTPFAVGVGSSRFSVTYSGSAYYANPRIYNDMLNDSSLKILGKFADSAGNGFAFASDYVKVTSGGMPMADSADNDLMIASEFRALEHGTNGTLKLTKLPLT